MPNSATKRYEFLKKLKENKKLDFLKNNNNREWDIDRKVNLFSPDEVFLINKNNLTEKISLFKISNDYIIDEEDNNKKYQITSLNEYIADDYMAYLIKKKYENFMSNKNLSINVTTKSNKDESNESNESIEDSEYENKKKEIDSIINGEVSSIENLNRNDFIRIILDYNFRNNLASFGKHLIMKKTKDNKYSMYLVDVDKDNNINRKLIENIKVENDAILFCESEPEGSISILQAANKILSYEGKDFLFVFPVVFTSKKYCGIISESSIKKKAMEITDIISTILKNDNGDNIKNIFFDSYCYSNHLNTYINKYLTVKYERIKEKIEKLRNENNISFLIKERKKYNKNKEKIKKLENKLSRYKPINNAVEKTERYFNLNLKDYGFLRPITIGTDKVKKDITQILNYNKDRTRIRYFVDKPDRIIHNENFNDNLMKEINSNIEEDAKRKVNNNPTNIVDNYLELDETNYKVNAKIKYRNGDIYEGELVFTGLNVENIKKSGKGILYSKTDGVICEGKWINDIFKKRTYIIFCKYKGEKPDTNYIKKTIFSLNDKYEIYSKQNFISLEKNESQQYQFNLTSTCRNNEEKDIIISLNREEGEQFKELMSKIDICRCDEFDKIIENIYKESKNESFNINNIIKIFTNHIKKKSNQNQIGI